MAPRPVFEHEGKQCYTIAELSTSNAKGLDIVFSTLSTLSSVPIEMCEKDMRFSGMSSGHDFYIDLKLSPFISESSSDATYVDTRVTTTKKRKTTDKEEEEEVTDDGMDVFEGDEGASSAVPPKTKTDYYVRYDDHDVTVQADIDCLLHMTGVAKRDDVLRLTVYSLSPTGEAERILVSSWGRNTATYGTVRPQDLTCEVWSLPTFVAVSMVTLPSDDLADHIKSVSNASQSSYVTLSMTGNQNNAATPQLLTLSATGDTGTITREIRSDAVANVKFFNDKHMAPDACVNYRGTFGSKPIVQISKISPICRFVRMYLNEGAPLKLHYAIPDLGNLFFFLTPRLEEDEQ